jgi:hypothetical protein
VFDASATVELPEVWREEQDRHDAAVIELLTGVVALGQRAPHQTQA